ncbi:helicase-associated domain-containing protein [Lentzea sp. BCCO 10_0061]|uniref:Helicase-associated domain-containing protein n=1 Tax=Lentzea sokolovensis TaxID=3095429 RepID=A0ABU4UVL5_9PSEU|nr:helicase-associated domain-containing protein [Lentzea sp. BCCO 10_0061]MDX8143558.1 helicase-associated domain-containing protein [Lentzea sp. BCCO 10_0061]
MSGTTLADWLRAQDDAALVALLRARPDLATPPPADMSVLATRVGTRASIARACEDLDTFTLAVLEALVVQGADAEPVALPTLGEILGPDVKPRPLKQAVGRLRSLALAWGDDDALSVPPVTREAFGSYPGGLGRTTGQTYDLQGITEGEQRVLQKLAAGPPIGDTKDASRVVPLDKAETPVQRLLARGLLLRRDPGTVELPREIALELRGGRPLGPIQVTEPKPKITTLQQSSVDATGGGEALELVRHVENLIASWSAEPAPVLRTGGLGVRELRKVAKDLDVDERRAALLIELVVGADMAANTEASEPEWMPTTKADVWLAATTEVRWATIAHAWLELPRLPALVGRRDEKDKLFNPLADEIRRAQAPRDRRWVLEALGAFPKGTSISNPTELAALLAWRAPRRGGRQRDELVRWTVEEGTAVGVLALGSITSAGRVLLEEGPGHAAKALGDALPAPLDHVLVQADLTVVAPGRLEPELADELALVANVESAGSATVYRISEATVRRALDSGRTADELQELFKTRSRTPVPQSLSYLIDDAARRHGRLRGGAAGSFLRCDDSVLISEVLAHPEAGRLELRRIAPTVLVSPLPLADVLDGLRSAGFAPAAEGPDGQVLDLRPGGRRTTPRQRTARKPVSPAVPADERLGELVRLVRAGDRAAATPRGERVAVPGHLGAGPSATLSLLQQAARARRRVLVGFVDSHGTAAQRVIEPHVVGGGVLEGYDHSYGEVLRFPLHRVTSAALVDED